jgi:hypothetical protein
MAAGIRTDLTNIDAEIAAIGKASTASARGTDIVKQKLDRLLNGATLTDVDVDLNGDFDAAMKKDAATQENLAKLIHSLNETSKGLTDQFKSLSSDTLMERAVAFF